MNMQCNSDFTCTKFSVKLLARHLLQVCNHKRPQVQDVVTGKTVPLLNHQDMGSTQQLQLDRRPQATRTATDDEAVVIFQNVVAATLTNLRLVTAVMSVRHVC